jgi:hypothetical protein
MSKSHTTTEQPEAATQTTPSQRAAEKEDFLRMLNPALREHYERIEGFFTDLDARTLLSRHELGSMAKQVLDEAQQRGGCSRFGDGAWGRLLAALGDERARELQEAVRFAQAYTRAEVDDLSRMRLADGRSLSYSILRQLAAVVDSTQRQQLLERTVAECLTADELAKVIQKQLGRPKTGRGNKPKVPVTLAAVIEQQARAADEVLNRSAKTWDNPKQSLTTLAHQLPPEAISQARAEALRLLAERMRRLAKVAEERAQEAERAYEQFKAILDQRAAKPAETNEKADAADEGPSSAGLDSHDPVLVDAPGDLEKVLV